jgi:hypothetical protein
MCQQSTIPLNVDECASHILTHIQNLLKVKGNIKVFLGEVFAIMELLE